MLRQLERNGNRWSSYPPVAHYGWPDENESAVHAAGLFIEAVTQPAHHTLHYNLAGGKKGDTKNDIALHIQLRASAGVLHGRLGDHFEIGEHDLLGRLAAHAALPWPREFLPNPPYRSAAFPVPWLREFRPKPPALDSRIGAGLETIADSSGAHHTVRRNGGPLHAAIRIADRGDCGRTRGIGIGGTPKVSPRCTGAVDGLT